MCPVSQPHHGRTCRDFRVWARGSYPASPGLASRHPFVGTGSGAGSGVAWLRVFWPMGYTAVTRCGLQVFLRARFRFGLALNLAGYAGCATTQFCYLNDSCLGHLEQKRGAVGDSGRGLQVLTQSIVATKHVSQGCAKSSEHRMKGLHYQSRTIPSPPHCLLRPTIAPIFVGALPRENP